MIIDHSVDFPKVLLKLELLGSSYFFAESGPLTISVDGDDTTFNSGMEVPSIIKTADLFGVSASAKTLSVTVDLRCVPELGALLGSTHAIYTCRASVYLWTGGAFEDASRMFSGRVTAPTFADPADPKLFGFTIDRDLVDRAYGLDKRARVRQDSFSGAGHVNAGDVGLFYPVPIGQPGKWRLSPIGYTAAYPIVPAWWGATSSATSDHRLVVAAGRVGATEAYVWVGNLFGGIADLAEYTDNYGNLVTCLDGATYSGDVDELYNSSELSVALIGEGVPATDGAEFRGLGDVVVWALGKTSLATSGDIDWDRVLGNVDALNALGRVDTYLIERVSMLDWLISDVLSYFPVFVDDAGDGLYVGVWSYADADDSELLIDTGLEGYYRRSAVGYEDVAPVSRLSVNGLLSQLNGAHLESIEMSGNPDDSETDGFVRHPLLIDSFRLFNESELSIDVDVVQDPATLARLADFYAYKYALPRAVVSYSIPWRTIMPRIGMSCKVNDPPSGLSSKRAVVRGFEYANGELTLSVSINP